MAFPSKVNKKEAIALYKGDMPVTEIAEKYGVTKGAISKLVSRAKEDKAAMEEYRASKAEVFEHIQGKLLSAVSEDNPKEAQSLVTSAAILEDKIRLERGQSTVNTTVDIRMLIASLPSAPSDQPG